MSFALPTFAASTTLQWDPNTEPDVSGYTLHYGSTVSRAYTTHLSVVGRTTVSQAITGLADNTTYYFAVTALDTAGNESTYSNEVVLTTPALGTETVSAPLIPSGPATGTVGVAYTYTASGSVSSVGHSVQYQFSWSDGSSSNWLAAGVTSASKTWSAPGTYTLVRVQARCSTDISVVSSSSPVLTVTIAAATPETVSAPSAPSGPTSGVVGGAYTYSTGNAVSSAGHAVEYRFSWSDGTLSPWVSAVTASATKIWNGTGTYTLVRAEARCALHPTILSSASQAITVNISSGAAESVSLPSTPAGPAGGDTNTMYVFSTGGSVSSAGHSILYRFHWGDGTTSQWVGPGQPVTAGKSWNVPGTYLVQAEASCATHSTVGSFSPAIEVSIAEGSLAPPDGYVLWSRSDTGQAALWKVNPSRPGTIPATSMAHVYSPSGVGAPWQATSYTHVDATTGYLLWARSDTGQAILWKVNPSVPGTIPATSMAHVYSPSGVGAPWQATSYTHVDATTGYVLWTNSDTGQAGLWKVNPSVPGTIPATSMAHVYSPSGVGAPWQATSFVLGNIAGGR